MLVSHLNLFVSCSYFYFVHQESVEIFLKISLNCVLKINPTHVEMIMNERRVNKTKLEDYFRHFLMRMRVLISGDRDLKG